MSEPAKKPIDDWEGVLKPFVGQIVWHYKFCNETNVPYALVVMKIGSNKRVAGLRMVPGGPMFEEVGGAVHMDHLRQQDGTAMSDVQKKNCHGWRHTEETLANHRLKGELERMGKTVVELAQKFNELIAARKPNAA